MSLEKKVRKTIKKELQTVNSSNAPLFLKPFKRIWDIKTLRTALLT